MTNIEFKNKSIELTLKAMLNNEERKYTGMLKTTIIQRLLTLSRINYDGKA